jgi:Mn-dependent DtxR family transcriptional regulator
MARDHELVLDSLEARLSDGLRRDARAVGRMEATVRVLLALPADGGIAMQELARRIARDPSTVTRFAARAENEGLVERTPGDDDRRRRLLALTREGRAVRDALLARRRSREASLKEGVAAGTGLAPDAVEWFLAAVADSLAAKPTDGA